MASVTIRRYASSGPAGVTTPAAVTIPAARQAISIAVAAANSVATPTINGVALPPGTIISFNAREGDSLPAFALVTVAGDDVIVTEIY